MLAAAAGKARTWEPAKVAEALDHTTGFKGVTGTITISPRTGNRLSPPVVILDVDSMGNYVIDPTWAQYASYPLPAANS
jgi:ABC-type branched-subunit amino acid transport system substrate-binding protein